MFLVEFFSRQDNLSPLEHLGVFPSNLAFADLLSVIGLFEFLINP